MSWIQTGELYTINILASEGRQTSSVTFMAMPSRFLHSMLILDIVMPPASTNRTDEVSRPVVRVRKAAH